MIEYTNDNDRFLIAYAKMWNTVFAAITPPERTEDNVHRHDPESRTEVQPDFRAE